MSKTQWVYLSHPENTTGPIRVLRESLKAWERIGWLPVDESKTNQPVKEEITLDSTQNSPGTPVLEDSANQEDQSWRV